MQAPGEDALRKWEARLSGIIALASEAIISINEAQEIILYNPGAEVIFGYDASEVLNQPLDLLLPIQHASRHAGHIRTFGESSVSSRRMGERRKISGRRKSGEEFPAEASISWMEIDGEKQFTVVLRDVTEQTRSQRAQELLADLGQALAASLEVNETLRATAGEIVKHLADFCAIHLVDDGVMWQAAAAHGSADGDGQAPATTDPEVQEERSRLLGQILELGAPQLMSRRGTPRRSHSTDVDARPPSPACQRLLEHLSATSCMVLPLQAREGILGSILFVSTSPGRVYDEDHLALAEEVARRAALGLENASLYRDAQDAVQNKDEILGVVSHDLGNPLQAIIMAANTLNASAPESSRESFLVSAILRSAERMERLIHDLLEFRRMESGNLSLKPAPARLALLLDEAVETLRPLADVKEIGLELSPCPPDLPSLALDAGRVMQVLSNLLGNAVKYSAPKSLVRISVWEEDGEVVVEVKDTGPGIPPDQLPRVFDRFWRAEKSGRHGIGLGLTIARSLVEAHGGRIWVESEVGTGSAFRFALPTPTPDGQPHLNTPTRS
ncbi:MAG: ATP-binding protein [Gemmatimonadota bacterium]